MPRKFKLGRHRKNEFRKRRACTLTMDHVATVTQHSQTALLLPSCITQPSVGQVCSVLPSEVLDGQGCSPLLPSGDSQPLAGQGGSSEAPLLPSGNIEVDTMTLSVPLTTISSFEMATVSALQQRIKALSVLTSGMSPALESCA